jgi:multidrug resistance efflux pump
VQAGQPLTDVATSVLGALGAPVSSSTTLRAPTDGIVASVDRPAGSVITNGEPILTMYDPQQLNFVAAVSPKQLSAVKLGMTAQISGPGLGRTLAARVARVVPSIGPPQPSTTPNINLVLTPVNQSAVADLVPGLRFSAKLDALSGGHNLPSGEHLG